MCAPPFLLYLCVCVHGMYTFHVEDRGQPWCHFAGTVYLTFNFFEIGSLIDLELAKWSLLMGSELQVIVSLPP